MRKCFLFLTLLFNFLVSQQIHALSYLCGGDEDGCNLDNPAYCFCIPRHSDAQKPFCLNLDEMTCKPLKEIESCPSMLTFETQGRCLTTLFESHPLPECPLVSDKICEQDKVYTCNHYGQLN